jgi:hypothetical protein
MVERRRSHAGSMPIFAVPSIGLLFNKVLGCWYPLLPLLAAVHSAGTGPRPSTRQRMPLQAEYAEADPDAEIHDITWNGYTLFSPESMIDDLVAFARHWRPDLVVWDEITFAGSVAARACGAPHVRLLIGVDGITQLRDAIRARAARPGAAPATDPLRDWLGPILRRYVCEFGEDVVVGDRTVDPMPPWHWQPPGTDCIRMRRLPFNGGARGCRPGSTSRPSGRGSSVRTAPPHRSW